MRAVTPSREALLALASEYEAGLKKCAASGYEEYGPDFQRKHQMVIDALRLAAKPADEGWQPIETAPKIEGRYIDLWFPQRIAGEYGRVPDCLWIAKTTVPGWYADCEHLDEIYYLGDGATHWRDRPEFPPISEPKR